MSWVTRLRKHFTLKNLFSCGFLLGSLFIFLSNAIHESYPDEFDNILGGWYMLHGNIIYKDFFTHHNPFAYLLAATITLFSGNNFVLFRVIYAVVLLSFVLGSYWYLKKRFGFQNTRFYLAFILLSGISATYFWGHMLLADSLSAFLLSPVFALLLLLTLKKEKPTTSDLIGISLLTSFTFLTALTYVYLLGIIYLYTLYLLLHDKHFHFKRTLVIISILAAPYVIFLVYLLLTGSLTDYWRQAIVFNGKYYAYTSYPMNNNGGFINPLRHVIVIAHDFFNNYYLLLRQIKDFNVNFPFNIFLAVSTTSFLLYLLLKRSFLFASVFFLFLTFSNVRSNPLTSGEKDYQSAVYIMLGLLSVCFVLPKLYNMLRTELEFPRKLLTTVIFLILSFYTVFGVLFLTHKFNDRVFNKYMGIEPAIYNRPQLAPIINAAITPDEYMWIGPFAFEDLFYAHGKIPSNYHILLPEFIKDPVIPGQMIADFTENKPTVIYFNKGFGIRGHNPEEFGKFFIDFLDKNYTTLYDQRDNGIIYRSVQGIDAWVDVETKLYIRTDKLQEVTNRLLEKNIIRIASE